MDQTNHLMKEQKILHRYRTSRRHLQTRSRHMFNVCFLFLFLQFVPETIRSDKEEEQTVYHLLMFARVATSKENKQEVLQRPCCVPPRLFPKFSFKENLLCQASLIFIYFYFVYSLSFSLGVCMSALTLYASILPRGRLNCFTCRPSTPQSMSRQQVPLSQWSTTFLALVIN